MSPYASPNDHRRYHYLELANRLRVLLICDPETDKSAASLAVNTGHFDDPVDRQGMAHFLEHMLFLGTRTYPKPGEYQQFMSRHGGSNNAWTGTEFTNFFFDIDNGFFEAGLDRFSQFFICPTFAPEWVDKERNAVDSEYRLKLQDDVRRSYQVHKETVNPAHPFSKFSVGNLDTLADLPGRDLRSDLIAFYETHYSADRMALVMLSPASIETQLGWCDRFFGTILDRRLGPPALSAPLYRLDDLGIRIQIAPVKETRKLALTFPLPSVDALYDKKPLTFLSHLIGYEGEGSLLSLLKARGWVNQLAAGGGISGANFKDFGVSFGLTPLGLAHVDDIIADLFGYLKLIERDGLQAWRYDEKRSVLESAFRFQERGRALDTVSGLVLNLFSYAPDDLIHGDYMMREYDEPLIRRFSCSTSASRGTLSSVSVWSVRRLAIISGRAAFLAPEIGTRPLSRLPPTMRIRSIETSPNRAGIEGISQRPVHDVGPDRDRLKARLGFRLRRRLCVAALPGGGTRALRRLAPAKVVAERRLEALAQIPHRRLRACHVRRRTGRFLRSSCGDGYRQCEKNNGANHAWASFESVASETGKGQRRRSITYCNGMTMSVSTVETSMPNTSEMTRPLKIGSSRMNSAPPTAVKAMGRARTAQPSMAASTYRLPSAIC